MDKQSALTWLVPLIAQAISQTLTGIVFSLGVYIGMIGSWVVMGTIAIGLTLAYFRDLSESVWGI